MSPPHEGHVRETPLACPSARRGERAFLAVHADDRSTLADERGGQECHVPGAAADVQHAHVRADARVGEQAAREVVAEPSHAPRSLCVEMATG